MVTNVALLIICNKACSIKIDESNWWIGNSATKHLTNSSHYFISFEPFNIPQSIKDAGQESLKTIGKGAIWILSIMRNRCVEMTFNNIWYVPTISKNLFSVLAAQDRNKKSILESTPMFYYIRLLYVCGKREVNGTLYQAEIKPLIADVNVVIDDKSDLLQLYQER